MSIIDLLRLSQTVRWAPATETWGISLRGPWSLLEADLANRYVGATLYIHEENTARPVWLSG